MKASLLAKRIVLISRFLRKCWIIFRVLYKIYINKTPIVTATILWFTRKSFFLPSSSEHETTEWANCGYRTLILFLHCGQNCQILFQICYLHFGFRSMIHHLIGKLDSFWVWNGKKQHNRIIVWCDWKQFHEFSRIISKGSSRICPFM